ncbi:class I SAM-dependent methyltransferase [Nocardia gipuzkoensis]
MDSQFKPPVRFGEGVAGKLVGLTELAVGECPVRFRAWDGSDAGPADAPVIMVHLPRALQRLVFDPDDVGLGRAFVAGDISIEGDIVHALDTIADFAVRIRKRRRLTWAQRAKVVAAVVELGAIGRRPLPPPEEFGVGGRLHSRSRDKAAVSSHYDVGNEFYRDVLGPSMVYSCAYWSDDPDCSLEQAQHAKLDLICRKLGLSAGMKVLDVGCGWGSFAIHAAREYGASVLGVTLSKEQAELARRRVNDAGLGGRVEIREQDWRDVAERDFDAIASIGMAEHVGREQYRRYAQGMWQMLRPGGRLLNHQIAAQPGARARRRGFRDAFVFPDGDLLPISTVTAALEDSGFEVRDVHCLREHYARTLRAWLGNLEEHRQRCVERTSEGRVRVWQLYMAASAIGFEQNVLRVNQTLAVRPDEHGRSRMPLVRERWLEARVVNA